MHAYSKTSNVQFNYPDMNIYCTRVNKGRLKRLPNLVQGWEAQSQVGFEFTLPCRHKMELYIPVQGGRKHLKHMIRFQLYLSFSVSEGRSGAVRKRGTNLDFVRNAR